MYLCVKKSPYQITPKVIGVAAVEAVEAAEGVAAVEAVAAIEPVDAVMGLEIGGAHVENRIEQVRKAFAAGKNWDYYEIQFDENDRPSLSLIIATGTEPVTTDRTVLQNAQGATIE